MKTIVLVMSLLCSLGLSLSAKAVDLFVALDGIRSNVEIGNVKYNPVLAQARIGTFFYQGIALELGFADTLSVDESFEIEASIESHYRVAFRLQSPRDGSYSAFVTLGYGFSELAIQELSSSTPIIEDLESPILGIGLEKQFDLYPNISYLLEFDRIYDDEDTEISQFSLGYQYHF